MLKKADILKVLAVLAEAYPDWAQKTKSPTFVDTWLACLGDIEPGRLAAAAVQYIQSSVYPPKIADLRTLALPVDDSDPDAAFELARRHVHSFSSYASAEQIERAMDSLRRADADAYEALMAWGGIQRMKEMLSEDVSTHRAQFRDCYQRVMARARRQHGEEVARAALTGGTRRMFLEDKP